MEATNRRCFYLTLEDDNTIFGYGDYLKVPSYFSQVIHIFENCYYKIHYKNGYIVVWSFKSIKHFESLPKYIQNIININRIK